MVQNYDDFVRELLKTGFSMGGGNDEGIYAVVPFSWNEDHPYDTPVVWHTGSPDTDPWEWRMRVLDERTDIAYGKFFFKKSGFITEAWFPYFLAARRKGLSFEEAFLCGTISQFAKRIYDVIESAGNIPLHTLKELAHIDKDDKSKFESALTELQMKLYITMCGRQQKTSLTGNDYGWSSTVFCTTEKFWGEAVFEKASKLAPEEAIQAIHTQIKTITPTADEKKVMKFIKG